MGELNFEISWDDEAEVWYTTETPIPGIVAEAPTVDDLYKKLSLIIAEMAEIRKESEEPNYFVAPETTQAPYIIKSIHDDSHGQTPLNGILHS